VATGRVGEGLTLDERPERWAEPKRMRRLTDDEMTELIGLARRGRTGPGRALDALWDLILQHAEGMSLAEAMAAGRVWLVQNYAIAGGTAAGSVDIPSVGRVPTEGWQLCPGSFLPSSSVMSSPSLVAAI
jgi:hypothetical protein